MKVTIKGHELELHYGNRLYIIYENAMSDLGQEVDPNSRVAQTTLVYAALQATLRKNKIEETLTADDVNDIIDENGGMQFLIRFSKWFSEKVEAETELVRKLENEDDEKPKKKSKI